METLTRDEAEARLALPKLTKEEAIAMLDKRYSLIYVDYNDRIEDVDMQAEIVSTGYSDKLWENDWTGDQQWESTKYIMDELYKEFDIEDIEEDIRQEIWDRDDSTPMDDLIKNTGNVVMYYDFDYEVNGYPENIEKEARGVARTLKIPYFQHEKTLKGLVANASYGGKLTLLFSASLGDFSGEIKEKYVVIKDASVCIMDRWNGSGHSVEGLGDFKVRFDRSRFKVDEAAPGYSFAGDVCGMSVDEATLIFTNSIKGVVGPKKARELSATEKREMAFEKKWKQTKECSAGDMNITRHEDTPYRNDFPCGNKCVKCGTFWVD